MRRKAFLFAVALLTLFGLARAQIIPSLPYTLTNNTPADANQVMANFFAIQTAVNSSAAKSGANSDITSLLGLTTPLSYTSGGSSMYISGLSGGSANAQTVASPTPNGFSLVTGKRVSFIAGFTNTGPTTLNVASTGAVNIFKTTLTGPTALAGGEIIANNAVDVWYDGTQYQLLNIPNAEPPGTIKDYAGFTAPAGYLLAAGQSVSRVTYSLLFNAITYTSTASTTSGSAVVTGIATTTTLFAGMPLGGNNVVCGTTIVSVDSPTQVTMANVATATGSTTLTFAPFGAGDCAVNGTFGIPDLRGRTSAGVDSTLARLTVANSGIRGSTLGAGGGNPNFTLVTANLPAYTPAGTLALTGTVSIASQPAVVITDPGHLHSQTIASSRVSSGTGGGSTPFNAEDGTTNTGTATTGISATLSGGNYSWSGAGSSFSGTAQGGTSVPAIVQNPILILNKIIKF